jgi:hypothetical protein
VVFVITGLEESHLVTILPPFFKRTLRYGINENKCNTKGLDCKSLEPTIQISLFFFIEAYSLDERPSGHSPGSFCHANRIVKKFSGGVFLVQATGSVRVSIDITGQLKVVIGIFNWSRESRNF